MLKRAHWAESEGTVCLNLFPTFTTTLDYSVIDIIMNVSFLSFRFQPQNHVTLPGFVEQAARHDPDLQKRALGNQGTAPCNVLRDYFLV